MRAPREGSSAVLPRGQAEPQFVPVVGNHPDQGADAAVQAWLTASPVVDPHAAWRRWARDFSASGLWPLLAGGFAGRPFRCGELTAPALPGEAETVLRAGWEGTGLVGPDGTPHPHPPWPGLAPGSGPSSAHDVVVQELPGNGWPRELLLVPATRPADALARLGWLGACNWSLSGADIAGVLRSWEDRFGAYVVAVGFADLDLVVTRPPTTDEQCRLLAWEHYAFCVDNFFPQVLEGPDTISPVDYARGLRHARAWHFWWD